MKGVVFTEFLEMAEARFSLAVVDRMLTAVAPASRGQYTSVGTYPVEELGALLAELARQTGVGAPELLKAFGGHLLQRFAHSHAAFFEGAPTAFAFLSSVGGYIHVEVKKLYPDAELPVIVCEQLAPDRMVLEYRSPRRLADLAEGLIVACAQHYGETIVLTRQDCSGGKGEDVRFTLTRAATA